MGRAPCCEKVGMKTGRWTAGEDKILSDYIRSHGEGSWRSLPKNAGLKRCGKSCRLRWINYLRSDLKRGNITPEEEDLIVKLHSTLGNRWSVIASNMPGRTDNEIKNYWNSHLSRKLHNFIRRKPTITNILDENTPLPLPLAPKRKLGRTSRSAMKPKLITNPKTHKNPRKTNKNVVVLPVTTSTTTTKENGKEEEEQDSLMVLSSGANAAGLGGPCGGYKDPTINGDYGVLCFNDDIFDDDTCSFLLNEPETIHVSSSSESSKNVVESTMVDEFIDWDFVSTRGEESQCQNLWDEKEGPDSLLSWLLNGEPLDHPFDFSIDSTWQDLVGL